MPKALAIILRFYFYVCVCFFSWIILPSYPAKVYASDVTVIISDSLRPYIEAADGLTGFLSENGVKFSVMALEKLGQDRTEISFLAADKKIPDAFVAIGPDALKAVGSEIEGSPITRIYSMVLGPYQVVRKNARLCGVSLDIPVDLQLRIIAKTLPQIKRLGLLFDPEHNTPFYESVSKRGLENNIFVSPIAVKEKKEIPSALAECLGEVDAVWMIPDRTVISETVIEYVIRESLRRKKPVVGYNRFFYERGAVAAFVFDYREMGKQAGELLLDVLNGSDCEDRIPRFKFVLNPRVLKTLNLSWSDPLPGGAEIGP